jgi:hypothetical protein
MFQWLFSVQYGGLRLARKVTLQHYFGITLLNGCRPTPALHSSSNVTISYISKINILQDSNNAPNFHLPYFLLNVYH